MASPYADFPEIQVVEHADLEWRSKEGWQLIEVIADEKPHTERDQQWHNGEPQTSLACSSYRQSRYLIGLKKDAVLDQLRTTIEELIGDRDGWKHQHEELKGVTQNTVDALAEINKSAREYRESADRHQEHALKMEQCVADLRNERDKIREAIGDIRLKEILA